MPARATLAEKSAGAVGAEYFNRAVLRDRLGLGDESPRFAVILGSGLGAVSDLLHERRSVPYSEISGLPVATVSGHAGVLHAGSLAAVPVMLFSGRFHRYEGRTRDEIVSIVSLAHALGARQLMITNAAGGIADDLHPGALLLLKGHIDLMFMPSGATERCASPLDVPAGCRAHGSALAGIVLESARECGISVREGVYAAVAGPSYETRAEIEMLRRLGADAVGMSTVPELLAAYDLGMDCAALSCITNVAAGRDSRALSHDDVIATGARMQDALGQLLTAIAVRLRS